MNINRKAIATKVKLKDMLPFHLQPNPQHRSEASRLASFTARSKSQLNLVYNGFKKLNPSKVDSTR